MTDPKGHDLHRIAIPNDLVIRLERTMCLGACPDYSLLVYGDGKIVYEDRHYVVVKGKRKGRISKGWVRQQSGQPVLKP
jgi:(2Fe-2S) ferredoxin